MIDKISFGTHDPSRAIRFRENDSLDTREPTRNPLVAGTMLFRFNPQKSGNSCEKSFNGGKGGSERVETSDHASQPCQPHSGPVNV